MYNIYLLIFLFILPFLSTSQIIRDDFEGNSTITEWFGDDCDINVGFTNPSVEGINTSAKVLRYHDKGGQYANVRFDVNNNLDLSVDYTFSIKIYVPSGGLTGNQPNQISLKLQDGSLAQPWSTQSEVIKPIILNQWQTVIFNFKNDPYINLEGSSLPPTQRKDFNRVVLQVNGENNTDNVLAFIDDFYLGSYENPDSQFDFLVWSDEFDENGPIDTSKWFHQTKLPNGGSWYNGEIQHYTNRVGNTFVKDGQLNLVAKKEIFTDQGHTKNYTSARLNSKFAFTYGRVEVRAKLPSGIGTWPAIWMLGKNINEDGAYWQNLGYGTTSWPACGEIDIMEHWGNDQNFVQSAMHTPSSFANTINKGGQIIPTASTAFHVYSMDWTSEKMVFSVDNIVHYIYNPPIKNAATWPFDAEQYILLNIAIQPTIQPGFTNGAMEIDYVRVYQKGPLSNTRDDNSIVQNYFPNPVTDELNIKTEKTTTQNVVLKIYDLQSKLISEGLYPINNNIVTLTDLSYLSSGIYIISYHLNNKLNSFKFIKS